MTLSEFDVDEARRRIEVISKLPSNPAREREMEALRRSIVIASSRVAPIKKTRGEGKARAVISYSEQAEALRSTLPAKEIEKKHDGTKRVRIRPGHSEKGALKDFDREDRERMERVRKFSRELNNE